MRRSQELPLLVLLSGLVVAAVSIILVGANKQARRQREADLDSTIEDSFPASDPPSHATVTSSGGPGLS